MQSVSDDLRCRIHVSGKLWCTTLHGWSYRDVSQGTVLHVIFSNDLGEHCDVTLCHQRGALSSVRGF